MTVRFIKKQFSFQVLVKCRRLLCSSTQHVTSACVLLTNELLPLQNDITSGLCDFHWILEDEAHCHGMPGNQV